MCCWCCVAGWGYFLFPMDIVMHWASMGGLWRCAHGLIGVAWTLGIWDVVTDDDDVVVHVLDLGSYGPRIPFWKVWKTTVVQSVEDLGLLMNDVVGPVYHGGYHSVVCHEYDVGGFSHPDLGWLSDEVIHGFYTELVLQVGFDSGGQCIAPEHLGCQWLVGIFEVFMGGRLDQMFAFGSGAQWMMALFNILVKQEVGNSFSFYSLGGHEMGYNLCSSPFGVSSLAGLFGDVGESDSEGSRSTGSW